MELSLFDITKRMNRLNVLHRIYITRAANEAGVFYGQPPILDYVLEHAGCSQTELAEALHVSAPSIATSVKRMLKTGLLQRTRSGSDSRANLISITDLGRSRLEECHTSFESVNKQLFSGFSPEDLEAFNGYLIRMNANISSEEFKDKSFFEVLSELQEQKNRKEEE